MDSAMANITCGNNTWPCLFLIHYDGYCHWAMPRPLSQFLFKFYVCVSSHHTRSFVILKQVIMKNPLVGVSWKSQAVCYKINMWNLCSPLLCSWEQFHYRSSKFPMLLHPGLFTYFIHHYFGSWFWLHTLCHFCQSQNCDFGLVLWLGASWWHNDQCENIVGEFPKDKPHASHVGSSAGRSHYAP